MKRRNFLQVLAVAPFAPRGLTTLHSDSEVARGAILAAETTPGKNMPETHPQFSGVPRSWTVTTHPTPKIAGKPIAQGIPASCKHTRWAHRPVDGKWYVCGGDYPNIWGASSAVSVVWAYDPATRLWEIAYPYFGSAGDVQAIACDEVSWDYDSKRDLFWKVTGFQYWRNPETWPGPSKGLKNDICTFDPKTRKWARVAGFGEWSIDPESRRSTLEKTWGRIRFGVYDPVSDSVWAGYGSGVWRYNCGTNHFRGFGFGNQFSPGAYLGGEPTTTAAIDPDLRKIWIVDCIRGRIFALDITKPDSPSLSKLCDLPAAWRASDTVRKSRQLYHLHGYDNRLLLLKSRKLLFLWGPYTGNPDSILVDVITGAQHPGPDLPKNAAGTGKAQLRTSIYDSPSDSIITGWTPGNQESWGFLPDRYWLYKPSNSQAAGLPQHGEVLAISGASTLSNVDPCPRRNCSYSGGLGQKGVIAAWNSGIYASEYGALGALVVRGGGDGDYWGNETYAFDLDGRRWSRLTDPSPVEQRDPVTRRHVLADPMECTHADGRLGVPHSYDAYLYLSPSLGGGTRGSLFIAQSTFVKALHTTSRAWVIDLEMGGEQPFSRNRPSVGSDPLPTCCLDTKRNRVWLRRIGNSGAIQYIDLDPTGKSYRVWTKLAVPWSHQRGYGTSQYYAPADLWLIADHDASQRFQLMAYRCSDPAAGRITLDVQGDTTLTGRNFGFAWCGDVGAFFLRSMNAIDAQKLWKLLPPRNPLHEPWMLQKISMGGDTVVEGSHRGYFKRFCYASKIQAIVWVSSNSGAVYAYRPETG